ARVDAKLRRERFPKSGPVVVCEYYGVPWQAIEDRRIWRKTARACGIPDSVFNMDSRAGAATEAQHAGVPLDERRAQLTHATGDQTMVYSRGEQEKVINSLNARAAYREAKA